PSMAQFSPREIVQYAVKRVLPVQGVSQDERFVCGYCEICEAANACAYNILIRGTRRGGVKEGFRMKSDMVRAYRLRPNAHLGLAFRIKEGMVVNGVLLDSAIYSTLISGIFKAGKKEEGSPGNGCNEDKDFEAAHRVLKTNGGERVVPQEMDASGCPPDTVTYNVMIKGFSEDKDFEAAHRVLKTNGGERVCVRREPGVSEANDQFSRYAKTGRNEDLFRLVFDRLEKMRTCHS
ncbi:hypothetical protein Tsubulata_029767, partial [Turnera subulata]